MERLGLEVFEWGRLITGEAHEYIDDQHFRSGKTSWLFAQMILYYLHRAVTGDWWICSTRLQRIIDK